jgi:hypothetical protein
MSSKSEIRVVPVNVVRTLDTIRDDVLSSVCKTIFTTGSPCDPGKKPSEYNWTESFWLQLSRGICDDLHQTYPTLSISDQENLGYHTKKIADYCDFLLSNLTSVGA